VRGDSLSDVARPQKERVVTRFVFDRRNSGLALVMMVSFVDKGREVLYVMMKSLDDDDSFSFSFFFLYLPSQPKTDNIAEREQQSPARYTPPELD